jgi:hypothetical protein
VIDTGIIRSYYYKFWYLAINQHGVGARSESTEIQASAKPTQLKTVITTNSNTMLHVRWAETPDDHGTPVTSYTVYLRQSDGVFSTVSSCNGADLIVFDAK